MARELDERSAFERAVADIAARFAAVDIGDLDDRIVESQRQLCGLLEVDRSWLWEPHGDLFTCTHLWSRDDIQAPVPLPDALEAREHLPWLLSQVEAGHIVAVSRIDDVPSAPDRESLRRIGTQSTITVPLSVGSKLIGILSFGTLRTERTWSGYTLEGLRLIAAVMANGLARHQATQALRSALDEVRRLRARLAPEHVQMRREVKAMKLPRQVAIDSASVRHLMEQVEQVAPTTATVLLMGETGSGKEVFAEAIHELSPRRNKPMVRLNCAAIPVSLIESELFGRERGAYTGALSRQAGRFEIADGSTIFLDEIGELPLDVQVKLLRVLQERTVERLGSSHPIKVNVRVIAATNRNLEQAVADKTFREDLYYRLNVFPLRVPPLRERVQDIPSLAWTFIDEFAERVRQDDRVAVEDEPRGAAAVLVARQRPRAAERDRTGRDHRQRPHPRRRAPAADRGDAAQEPQVRGRRDRAHPIGPRVDGRADPRQRRRRRAARAQADHARKPDDETGHQPQRPGGAARARHGRRPTDLRRRLIPRPHECAGAVARFGGLPLASSCRRPSRSPAAAPRTPAPVPSGPNRLARPPRPRRLPPAPPGAGEAPGPLALQDLAPGGNPRPQDAVVRRHGSAREQPSAVHPGGRAGQPDALLQRRAGAAGHRLRRAAGVREDAGRPRQPRGWSRRSS